MLFRSPLGKGGAGYGPVKGVFGKNDPKIVYRGPISNFRPQGDVFNNTSDI